MIKKDREPYNETKKMVWMNLEKTDAKN
jgi:hypothetical protein